MQLSLNRSLAILLLLVAWTAQAADTTQVSPKTTLVSVPATTVNVNPPTPAPAAVCTCWQKPLTGFEKGLTLMPILIWVILLLVVYYRLKVAGFTLKDALSENDTLDTKSVSTTANALAPATTTTQEAEQTTPGNRSTSRLVLFLSGLTAILIAVCLVTYYFYQSFYCGQSPDLSGLTNVVLSLGIGVIPYTINKLTK